MRGSHAAPRKLASACATVSVDVSLIGSLVLSELVHEVHRRGILSRRVTDRAAELPAASALVIRIRVASVPRLAKPAVLRARGIETVNRWPGSTLTCFEPSTTAARTLP